MVDADCAGISKRICQGWKIILETYKTYEKLTSIIYYRL
jgi:hypothetical protein